MSAPCVYWLMSPKCRATDFPRLQNHGRNNGIRHLKWNPYSAKITVTFELKIACK